ncbi:MAG: PD40 domain-containing protein [Caldilineaceae bacterium]|nr:PD40 domain-containing protein [Caldilineaceae bacterium]
MKIRDADQHLQWHVMPEVVVIPRVLDFGLMDHCTQQVRQVYVRGLQGVDDNYSVACGEDTPWVRITHVQRDDEYYSTPLLKLLVEVDTTLLAAEQTYTGWIEVKIAERETNIAVKVTTGEEPQPSVTPSLFLVPWRRTFALTVAAIVLIGIVISLLSSNRAEALAAQLLPNFFVVRPWADHSRLGFALYRDDQLHVHVATTMAGPQQDLDLIGWGPGWSPNGAEVAFLRADADGLAQVHLLNTVDDVPIQLTTSAVPKSTPVWAGNGERVAFLAGQSGHGALTVLHRNTWTWGDGSPLLWDADPMAQIINRIAGGDAMNQQGSGRYPATAHLPQLSGYTEQFAWSPDGNALLFDYYQEGQQVRILHVDSSGALQVVATQSWSPTWSPDGRSFAAVADDGLFRMALNGEDRYVLSDLEALQPAWSPDGKWIAFLAPNPPLAQVVNPKLTKSHFDDTGLWVIAGDGTSQFQLSTDCVAFAWSPSGQRLGYVTGSGQGEPPLYYLWTLTVGANPILVAEINVPAVAWQPLPK